MEQVVEQMIEDKPKPVIGQVFKAIDWVFEKLNVFLMASLFLLVCITVVLRYFFNISFIWAEEFILFVFIATTYFGIIMCVKEDEHIAIDFFVNKAPRTFQKIIKTVIAIIGIGTLLWIGKESLGWIEQVGSTLSPGMKIEYKYIYSWMPFSFFMCALYEVRKCVAMWLEIGSEEGEVN